MCPQVDAEDYDRTVQSPKVQCAASCSTPNAKTQSDSQILNIAASNISPVHIMQYRPSPFLTDQYFLRNDGRANFHFEQPKFIFNTVLNNAVCNNITQPKVPHNQQDNSTYMAKSQTESLEDTPGWRKDVSGFRRGHSTIASLLNSLPLNLVNTRTIANENSLKGQQDFLSSKMSGACYPLLSEGDCIQNEEIRTDIKIEPNIDTDRSVNDTEMIDKLDSYRNEEIRSNYKFDLNTTRLLANINGKKCIQDVDENNNFRLAQKYSDISDACASEIGNTTETSSSEEEQTDNGESSKKFVARVKQRRKSNYPRRSAVKEDPRFKGVTVWLQTSFKNGRSNLHISAFYSNVKLVSPSRRYQVYPRRCSTPRSCALSDQENSSVAYLAKEHHATSIKTCASCKTRRTPLWRDADDGTPLCNACGIRYKKYRLRCSKCWNIPKKEVKTYPNCPVCGASLRFSFHKKTW